MRGLSAVVAASGLAAAAQTLLFSILNPLGFVTTIDMWIWLSLVISPIVAVVGLPLEWMLRRSRLHESVEACLLAGGGAAVVLVLVLAVMGTWDPSNPTQPRRTYAERLKFVPRRLLVVGFVSGSIASLAFWQIQPFGSVGSKRRVGS